MTPQNNEKDKPGNFDFEAHLPPVSTETYLHLISNHVKSISFEMDRLSDSIDRLVTKDEFTRAVIALSSLLTAVLIFLITLAFKI